MLNFKILHVKSELFEVKTKDTELDIKLTDTKEIVATIEVENGKKLWVLFDGDSLFHGISEEIRKDVTKLLADQVQQEFAIK